MFHSAQSAIKWAFRISGTPIVKLSSINSMSGAKRNSADDGPPLSQQEKHAEAALIYKALERAIDTYGVAYLNAQYGDQLNGGNSETMNILVAVAMAALPTGSHSRRGVQKIIRKYFGANIERREVCETLKCSVRRYYEYREAIYSALDVIAKRTEFQAQPALELAGFVLPPQQERFHYGYEN